jgi:hypothetical protein
MQSLLGGKEQMPTRSARKLFRLWLVLSLIWIGGAAFKTWRDIPRDDWVRTDINELSGPEFAPRVEIFHPVVRVFIEHGVKVALIPPSIVLVSGFVFIWAVKRFRHPKVAP